jgi:transcription initiation factor TFIIIB Brf1 subunit/transcription initiation factor TFIIB
MAERRKKAPRKTARKSNRKASPRRWSQHVTRESDALDLKRGVFKQTSARKIAASLKRSAEHSTRRKSGAYRSALSMLTFYINRAGKNLPKTQRERLERAKTELKREFGRE